MAPTSLASVSCGPPQDSVEVGATTTTLSYRALDAQGREVIGVKFSFSSTSPDVGSVDASGSLTGLKVGTTVINASTQGRTCSIQMKVIPRVASLVVSPTPSDLPIGTTRTLIASVFDPVGIAISGRVVNWSTSNSAIAVVSPQGVVTPIAVGTVTVTASVGSKTAAAIVHILREPVQVVRLEPSGVVTLRLTNTRQLTATAYGSGPALTDRTITFTTSSPTVVSVSNSGLVTALSIGTATITAESETRTAQVTIVVTAIPVSTVSIVPSTLTLLRGTNQQLTAIPKDSAGNTLSLINRSVIWTTTDNTVASVGGSGVITGFAAGSADIAVVVDGIVSSNLHVVVNDPPVVSVQVTPNAATIAVGNSTPLVASARDVNQSVITGKSFTWSTSNAACATVSTNGVVQGIAAGTCTISATVDGVSGTAIITVNDPTVVSVQVTPNTNTIKVGLTVLLSAVARDVNQNVLQGKVFTWTTSSSLCATVTTNGLAAAIAVGSCTITATVDGISGTSLITVIP